MPSITEENLILNQEHSNYFCNIGVYVCVCVYILFFFQLWTEKAYQQCTISEMYEQNMLGLNMPPEFIADP